MKKDGCLGWATPPNSTVVPLFLTGWCGDPRRDAQEASAVASAAKGEITLVRKLNSYNP